MAEQDDVLHHDRRCRTAPVFDFAQWKVIVCSAIEGFVAAGSAVAEPPLAALA